MRRPRTQSCAPFLSLEFDQRLTKYALAAAAAGAGAMALSQMAEAKVVYTKTHQQIAPNTTIDLDLNNDGTPDFKIEDTFSTSFFSSFGRLFTVPIGEQNKVWGHTISRRAYASAFFSGAIIGPKGQFLPGAGVMAAESFLGGAAPLASSTCTAPWANVARRYLGLKFVVNGQVHFGWARLDVGCSKNGSMVSAVLTGYAYETVPNRPILTGEQSGPGQASTAPKQTTTPTLEQASLGRLAQGAFGLSAWRRR